MPHPFTLRSLALLQLLAVLALHPATSMGAQQGSPGTSSTGSIDITYTQGLNARISGMTEFNFGIWSGAGDLAANDNICIGRSGVGFFGTGTYRIRASGDGAPGDPSAFTLSNGVNTITYQAYFNDQTGTANRQSLTAGVTLTGQTSGGFPLIFNLLFGCVIQNANLSIVVPETELRTAAGNYAGTLALLLIPD